MVIPLFVGREKSILALDQAMRSGKQILLVAQKQADVDDPGAQDLYRLGTIATILQLLKLPDGTVKVLVEGAERAKIEKLHTGQYFSAEVSPFKDVEQYDEREMDVLARSVTSQFEQYVKLNRKVPPEVLTALAGIEQPGRLADNVAAHMSLKLDAKQKVLEIQDVRKRLEHILALIEGEMDVLQIEKRIRGRVKQQMEKSQREYYLNEQMKAIQKELGEIEDAPNELAELEQRIQKAGMPKEARDKAMSELNKLKLMSPMSAEATVVRNYVDWLVKCPWKKKTKVHTDVVVAEKVLGRRSLRPGKGERAHRRIPRGPAASEDAEGPDPVPGRSAGRRQDFARSVDRARHQPQVRAHVARRRARRGRDPRPSPHLHRLDARQDHPEHGQDRLPQSAVPARRSRQDGDGFPRRSVFGAARSARPGAELDVQRPLSGSRLRPVRSDVRVHGEQPEHSGAAPRPHGSDPPARLHRGREERDRAALPRAEADEAERPEG
jgi:Lon protease-like protein